MISAPGRGSLWEKRGQCRTSVFEEEDTVPSLAGPVIWLDRVGTVSIGFFIQGWADVPVALWKMTTVLNSAAKLLPKQSGSVDRSRTDGSPAEMEGGHRAATGKARGAGSSSLVGFGESARMVPLQFQGS